MNAKRSLFECVYQHLQATALMAILLGAIAVFTQPYWAPFGECSVRTAEIEGAQVSVLWECTVHNRYPVTFHRRLVHTDTGVAVALPHEAGKTLKTGGPFLVSVTAPLPTSAQEKLPGEWCLITTAQVAYNRWYTRVKSYVPVCLTLAKSEENKAAP